MILDVVKNRFKRFFLAKKTSKLFFCNNSICAKEVKTKSD